MTSLADQIAKLTNPTPTFADPEDVDDGTGAKLLNKLGHDDDLVDSGSGSKLRRQVAPLLVEEDVRYAGRRTSRSKLLDQDHADELDDGESEDEADSVETNHDIIKSDDDDVIKSSGNESESEEEEEQQLADFREKLKLHKKQQQVKERKITKREVPVEDSDEESRNDAAEDEDDDDDEEDEDDEEEMDSGDEEEEEGKDGEEEEEAEEEEGVQPFSATSIDEEIQKGKAARAQLNLWDNLLETRIKLQKVLGTVNQLPQPDTWRQFGEGEGEDYRRAVKAGQAGLQKVLEQLVKLQTALLLQNPETKHVVAGAGHDSKLKTPTKTQNDNDDEEITSESDVASDGENDASEQRRLLLKRKIKMADYPEFLAKRHKDFQQYRNTTIQKWFDKTRVASGKLSKGFTAFEQSALKQIEQILSDKDRLIKRTQMKRSTYRVLGKDDIKQQQGEHKSDQEEEKEPELTQERLPTREHLKDYDEEIFDDDDFYHQLLRELIDRKTSDLSDPVALSRQWLEVQKLRTKIKKKVDTKASKGRKIRYEIHPKLVNFMAPDDVNQWIDEQRDELYSSLFGKRHSEAVSGKAEASTADR